MNTKRLILGVSLASLLGAGLALPVTASADRGGRDWDRHDYRDHYRGDRYKYKYKYRYRDHDRHYYRPSKRRYYDRHDHGHLHGYWFPGAVLGLHFIFDD